MGVLQIDPMVSFAGLHSMSDDLDDSFVPSDMVLRLSATTFCWHRSYLPVNSAVSFAGLHSMSDDLDDLSLTRMLFPTIWATMTLLVKVKISSVGRSLLLFDDLDVT